MPAGGSKAIAAERDRGDVHDLRTASAKYRVIAEQRGFAVAERNWRQGRCSGTVIALATWTLPDARHFILQFDGRAMSRVSGPVDNYLIA